MAPVKNNKKASNAQAAAGQPRVIAGRYRLEQQIGKGGNARVYNAIDERSGNPVAVKLFFRELDRDPSFVARFRREVRIASKLRHPNIVRTLDYGFDEERYFLVMDYLDGSNLQEYINRHGPLELWEVVPLMRQLCEALHYAHSQGIVHRDIKPQNVLLTHQNEVRLADFGLARAVANTGLTVTNPTIGTIGYLAPEQIQNAPLTTRTDIYSLGVLMFEMVTKRLPFENPSALAVALAHVQQDPPLPRIYNSRVSPALELVIRRCMAKDPARRYGDVLQLRDELVNCLADEINYRPVRPGSEPVVTEKKEGKIVALPVENPLNDLISITLPTWVVNQYDNNQKPASPVAPLTPENPPAVPDLSGDFSEPLDAITPYNLNTGNWNNSAIFEGKSLRSRWLLALLVGAMLVMLAFVAFLGFRLVSEARQQSGATSQVAPADRPAAPGNVSIVNRSGIIFGDSLREGSVKQ